MKKFVSLFTGFVVVAIMLALLPGCDGIMVAEGRVYEWTNAPEGAISKIFITENVTDFDRALNDILRTLGDNITIIPLNRINVSVNQNWRSGSKLEVYSDTNGDWRADSMAAGKGTIIFTVSDPAYKSVNGTAHFQAAGFYSVVTLLVRDR